jgi:hypothetical protein
MMKAFDRANMNRSFGSVMDGGSLPSSNLTITAIYALRPHTNEPLQCDIR